MDRTSHRTLTRNTTAAAVVAVLSSVSVPAASGATAPPTGSNPVPPPVHTWVGSQPGENYGWAVSELGDVDGDHVADAIIGAPFYATAAGPNAGQVDIRSSRSGLVLAGYVGQPREYLGYAIADAGDADGDGVHDVVIGAPQGRTSCTVTETGA